ncbi:MAG: hypothetical protein OXH15_17230 [Gammaproteobacteria bacterium]|nr:hypothetical protein [Gammaproteobacteria bacterium]
MVTYILLIAGVCGFLLVRLGIEPRLGTWLADVTAKGRKAAAFGVAKVSVIRFVGTFCGLTAIGALIGRGLIWWVESLNEVAKVDEVALAEELELVNAALASLEVLRSALPPVGLTVALVPAVILFVLLAYMALQSGFGVERSIRRRRSRMRAALLKGELAHENADERRRNVEAVIAEAHAAGEATEVTERLCRLLVELEIVQRLDDDRLEGTVLQALDEKIVRARAGAVGAETIATLYESLVDFDVIRHVEAELKDAGEPGLHRGWLSQTVAFVMGVSVLTAIRRLGAAVTMAATVLLIPASLVISAKEIREAADQAHANLENGRRNLTLALSAEETEADLEELTAVWPEEAADRGDGGAETGSGESNEEGTPKDTGEESAVADTGDGDPTVVGQTESREGRPEEGQATDWCLWAPASSPEDCDPAAAFGRLYEIAWATFLYREAGVSPPEVSDQESSAWRREWTRRQVLAEAVRARGDSAVQVVAAAESDADAWRRAVVDADVRGSAYARPVTPVGQDASAEARPVLQTIDLAVAGSGPGRGGSTWTGTALSGVISVAIDQLGVSDVPGLGAGEGLAGALKQGLGSGLEEFLRPVSGTGERGVESDFKYFDRAAQVNNRRVLVAGIRNGRIDNAAFQALEGTVDRETIARYREAFGRVTALDVGKPGGPGAVGLELARGPDGPRAEALASHLRGLRRGAVAVNALASYATLFPAVAGQSVGSLQAEVARIVDSKAADRLYGEAGNTKRASSKLGDGGRSTGIEHRPTDATRGSARRARSYQELRGFHRVGGVLIGREPDGVSEDGGPDIVGFDSEVDEEGRSVVLRLRQSRGSDIELGPYDAAAVHLALAYAADGRPTAVTLVSAEPLLDLRVLLHPAIVDTQLGCRAIVLDTFADALVPHGSSVDVERDRLNMESRWVVELYEYAWAARAVAALQRPGPICGLGEEDSSDVLLSAIAAMVRFGVLSEEGGRPTHGVEAALEPLYDRPRQFDRDLVSVIRVCWERDSIESAVECIDGGAKQLVGRVSELGTIPCSWFAEPAAMVTVSGVRERAYVLDSDLRFAMKPDGVDGGPLRFIVQNSFDSSDSSSEGVEPWELWSMEDDLQSAVLDEVKKDREAKSALLGMYEFTALQRLFRAAFGGRLGGDFPVARLARLARDTAEFVKDTEVRTRRWLESPASYVDVQVLGLSRSISGWEEHHLQCAAGLVADCVAAITRGGEAGLDRQVCALMEGIPSRCLVDTSGVRILADGLDQLDRYRGEYESLLEIRSLLRSPERETAARPVGMSCEAP